MVLLVKRLDQIFRQSICVKIMGFTITVREIYQFLKNKKKKMEKSNLYMDFLLRCLATLSLLVVRIVLLEYSKIHEKVYKFIVWEFEGF